jgi:hypothetical protein
VRLDALQPAPASEGRVRVSLGDALAADRTPEQIEVLAGEVGPARILSRVTELLVAADDRLG